MTRRDTLEIILSSGIEFGNISLILVNYKWCIEVIVKRPTRFLDLSMMHKKWLTGV